MANERKHPRDNDPIADTNDEQVTGRAEESDERDDEFEDADEADDDLDEFDQD